MRLANLLLHQQGLTSLPDLVSPPMVFKSEGCLPVLLTLVLAAYAPNSMHSRLKHHTVLLWAV